MGQAQRQISLDQTVQRLGGVRRGLEILDHNTEPVDGSGIVAPLQVIAPDLHFLAGQMVKGQVELENRGFGVFAVGIEFDHLAQ